MGILHSNAHDGDSGRCSQAFFTPSLETPRSSKVCSLRPWTSVRRLFHQRALPPTRNKVGILHSLAPQTDGQTECVNQELDQYLWLFVNEQQDDWYDLLPMAEFQHNNHVHSATQQPPFLLNTGRIPCMGFEP